MFARVRKTGLFVVVSALAVGGASRAMAVTELITNGGFETGTLAGWTVTDLPGSSGSFFGASGLSAPLSGTATVGPAAGTFYAVSDQVGPGTHALSQSFTVPGPVASVILSFDMFVNDSDSGPIVDPVGLDHTGPRNQHARVDILTAGASAFDTGAGVVTNLFTGVDPQASNPNPYTPYVFDLTPFVGAGGTFQLRFAEVDNQLFIQQGVDNVSIQISDGAIPEPLTTSLGLMGLGAMGLTLRRRTA